MGKIEEQIYQTKDKRAVIIRTARESDAEAYLALGKSIMSEQIYSLTQAEELNLTLDQEREWLRSNLQDDSHLVLVAEIQNQIVAQLDFSNGHRKRNAHTGEFGMGVRKDFREMGIGSLMLTALIEWAQKNPKIEKVNLSVHEDNLRAIATYKKLGFTVEGLRTKDLKYAEGIYVNTVLMGLNV